MKRFLSTILVIAMLMSMAITTTATTTDPITLPDLDCPGWWSAHTEGIKVTEEGVTITFTNTTYESATGNHNCPLFILYTGDEAKVQGAGYCEYWVHRADNFGWGNNGYYGVTLADETFFNTNFLDNLTAAGISRNGFYTDTCWDTLLTDLKAGCECIVYAYLEGNNAVVTISCAGVVNTMTLPVDTTKDVYLSLTGELCTLSNIQVSYNTTNMLACTSWWSNHYDSIEITESGVSVDFTSTTFSQAANNWNGPLWIAYTSSDSIISGADYIEYWVQRGDNFGWGTNYSYVTDESATDWDNFLSNLKSGVSGNISAYLDGNYAVIAMDFNDLITTVTIEVDATKPVYLSLTGEGCMLANINVCYHDNTEIRNDAAASCTTDGYTGDTYCADCGKLMANGTSIPHPGHTEGEAIRENEVAPGCTTAGSYDSVVKCSVCGTELSRTPVSVDPIDHAYGEVTYTWNADHTQCTASRTCGNDAFHVETIQATITSNSTATCRNDGEITYTATFAEDWATTQTAVVPVQATGDHVFANFVERVAATCTEDGYEIYACGCGIENRTVLTKTGHTAADAVKENEVAPTCTEKGGYDSVVYCSTCHAELSKEHIELEANGHSPADAVRENEVAPTCTEKGGYDSVVYCTTCHAELSKEHTELEAIGHSPADAVKENEKAPSCTEKGGYDSVVYCATCEAELDRENVTVNATGHNYLNGNCTVCNAEDPNYIEGTLDCPGWWVAHTDGIKLDEYGVTITLKSTTYADAANNWNSLLYVLYTNNENVVNIESADYLEYWVQRVDNYGWIGATNRWSGDEALAAAGITYAIDETAADWSNFLAPMKEGIDVTIQAKLDGDKAVIIMEANGLITTVCADVDTAKSVYLSLTGELCTLTDIVVASNAPTDTEPEATEPEATEPEATEPEATEPEATEPEATEPEATEPEATEPEATEPEATEPEATEPAESLVTDLGDLDCSGWWTNHSAGVALDTDGVTITMDSKTYENGTNNWNAPIVILYSGDEAKVNGASYYEYWVHRADNYGWAGGWGNFLNTGANLAELNALGVTYESSVEDGSWDNWVADLQAGVECTVDAKLVGSNAVLTIECNGVKNTITIPVDASKPLYLSVSGEMCVLSNITATSHKQVSEPSKTGDHIELFVAMLALSAISAAVIVTKKKEF